MSSFCKSYSHFFSKNTCELDIVLTRTVNILTTNELVKLTILWTTGPSPLRLDPEVERVKYFFPMVFLWDVSILLMVNTVVSNVFRTERHCICWFEVWYGLQLTDMYSLHSSNYMNIFTRSLVCSDWWSRIRKQNKWLNCVNCKTMLKAMLIIKTAYSCELSYIFCAS